MEKVFLALVTLFIALACCVDSGEKIIGESIREDVFVRGDPEGLKDELIIEPGETVSATATVTELTDMRLIRAGAAELRFVLEHPDGNVSESTTAHGRWFGSWHLNVSGTGVLEVSVKNLEDKPAYLWYTLYVVPQGTQKEKLKEFDAGDSTEIEYLILS